MKKSIVVLLHFLYWAPKFGMTIFYLFALSSGNNRGLNFNGASGIQVSIFIAELISFYLFYFYLFPSFLAKKKFTFFILLGFAASIILSLPSLISYINLYPNLLNNNRMGFKSVIISLIAIPSSIIFSGILGSLLKGFINWYSEIRLKEQLAQKNLQSELALLKAQINPHFLFNTINNIDILIEKDPKTASKYLKQLSEIMRFMLYETSSDLIPLTTELEYIAKYIELQKIRTANERYVNFTITGENEKLMIAPAIFIPFIENAFKHSTNKKIEDAINISIKIAGNDISFTCRNYFDNSKTFTQEKSGLGIDLIKQRLKLIYNDKHELDIIKTANQFEVKMKIKTK